MGKEEPGINLKKSQFEGHKGRLLLELQKSYKGDSRFKLTDKFKDDIEVGRLKNSFRQITDKDILEMQPEPESVVADDFQQERQKQLSYISSIVPESSRPIHKPIQKVKSTQELIVKRFDPTSAKGNKMLQQI